MKHNTFFDINDANTKMQAWRDKYNNIRPHETLDMLTPSDVYTKSDREYKGNIPKFEYSGMFPVKKVNGKDYISFDKQRMYFSETFSGEYIELRPSEREETIIACFRNFRIAEFNSISGIRLNRFIDRL